VAGTSAGSVSIPTHSRPFQVSVPTATAVPGDELVQRRRQQPEHPLDQLGRRRPAAAGQLGDPAGQHRRCRPDPGRDRHVDQDRAGAVALGRAAGLAGGQRHRHPQQPGPAGHRAERTGEQ
jgi:hypothetical protein